jgi:formylglycine-generating enzyme required for sulfatase activity
LFKGYPYNAKDGREDLNASGPRVLRGGSFYDSLRHARCASRSRYDIGNLYLNVGFRVAASPVLS